MMFSYPSDHSSFSEVIAVGACDTYEKEHAREVIKELRNRDKLLCSLYDEGLASPSSNLGRDHRSFGECILPFIPSTYLYVHLFVRLSTCSHASPVLLSVTY